MKHKLNLKLKQETKDVTFAVMLMFDGSNYSMSKRLGPLNVASIVDMLTGDGGIIEHGGIRYAVPGLPVGASGALRVDKVPDESGDGYDALVVRGVVGGDSLAVHTFVDKYVALWLRVACMLCGVHTKAIRVEYAEEYSVPGVMRIRGLDLDPMVLDQQWDDNVNALLESMRRLADTGTLAAPVYRLCAADGAILHPFCMPEYVLAFADKFGPADIFRSADGGWMWEPMSREDFEKLPVHHKKLDEK